MVDDQCSFSGHTAQLQEAIDTIVQSFGHPETVSLTYRYEGSQKRTILEVSTDADTITYELVYDGQDDAEPELKLVDDTQSSP